MLRLPHYEVVVNTRYPRGMSNEPSREDEADVDGGQQAPHGVSHAVAHSPAHAVHEPDVYELIVRSAHHVRRRWMEQLEPGGPTPHEFRALRAAIEADGGARLSDVAERLRIAPRSATEVVDSLEAKGLVRRAPSPSDRRAVLVEPTPAGRELAAQAHEGRARIAAQMLAPLGADEIDQLRSLLLRLDHGPARGEDRHSARAPDRLQDRAR